MIDQGRCLRPKFVRLSTNTSASSSAEMVLSTAAMTRLAWRYSEREFMSSSKLTPLNDGKVSWIFGWVSKSLRINRCIFPMRNVLCRSRYNRENGEWEIWNVFVEIKWCFQRKYTLENFLNLLYLKPWPFSLDNALEGCRRSWQHARFNEREQKDKSPVLHIPHHIPARSSQLFKFCASSMAASS